MADNTILNPGVGGDTIATDDIGGVKYQWVKVAYGADSAVTPVTDDVGLPVRSPTNQVIGTAAQAGDTVTAVVAGSPGCIISITGAFVMTNSFEGSVDGGATWFAVAGHTIGGLGSGASSTTGAVTLVINCSGCTHVRTRVSAYTSGSASITIRSSLYAPSVGGSIGSITIGVAPGVTAASLGKAEDAAHTSGDTGVFMLGVRNDARVALTNTDLDYSPLAVHPTGAAYVQALLSSAGLATNAPSQHHLVAAAGTNATSVKGSAGGIQRIIVTNTNAALRYLKFFNKATAPTVGTDTPVLTIGVPPLSTLPINCEMAPIVFTNGIAYAMVTGAADLDSVAVAANDLITTIYFV
jgi:hypothetical protein